MRKLIAESITLLLLLSSLSPAPTATPEPITEFTEPLPTVAVEPPTEPTEVTTAPTEPMELLPREIMCADVLWNHLRERFSPAVSAGIMGNVMAECAGGTYDLRWTAYGEGGDYYGICQWNRWDFPEVQGMDLLFQIDYLLGNIEYQMGDAYDRLLDAETPADAALIFARNYERCASFSYGVRQSYARQAYEDWRGRE